MADILPSEIVKMARLISPKDMATIALQYLNIGIETIEHFEESHPNNSLRFNISCLKHWCNRNGNNTRKRLYDLLKEAQSKHGLLDLKTFELGQCKARPFNFHNVSCLFLVYFLFVSSVPQHIMLVAL